MILPAAEWRPDLTDFNAQSTRTVRNVIPRGDGYGPVKSLQAYTDALAAACRGAFMALKADGSIQIFAGTATKLYTMSNTDLSWSNVSSSSGSTSYSCATTDFWQFTQVGDVVIATQQGDNPQAFTLNSSTYFADLAGSPPKATHVTTIAGHVIFSGLVGDKRSIQWSALDDPTGWTVGTDGCDLQTFADGGIVKGVLGSEFDGLIFQDSAIRRMTFVGGDLVFTIDRISDNKGIRAPYSAMQSAGRSFFVSATGFEEIVQGGYPSPIGSTRFNETFMAEWDSHVPHMLIGVADPNSTRVWWFYKSTTGITGYFDRAIVWDWALQRGGYVSGLTTEFVMELGQAGVTLEGLDDINSSIDALPQSLDAYLASFGTQLALADSSHQLGFLTGDNLEAILDTPDIVAPTRVRVRQHRPITDSGTVYGSVFGRQKSADAAIQSTENAMNDVGFVPHRVDTRHVRIRNRIPAATTWTYWAGVDADTVPTGMR